MAFHLVHGDITKSGAEGIVNAANAQLRPGGGVCGAIFSAAGYNDLEKACRALGGVSTGQAAITDGFNLSKKIIHAAGPVYDDGKRGEEKALRGAYKNSLRLASENELKSVAFPLISSGIYGYPYEDALRIAREELENFSKNHPQMEIYLYLYP